MKTEHTRPARPEIRRLHYHHLCGFTMPFRSATVLWHRRRVVALLTLSVVGLSFLGVWLIFCTQKLGLLLIICLKWFTGHFINTWLYFLTYKKNAERVRLLARVVSMICVPGLIELGGVISYDWLCLMTPPSRYDFNSSMR